MAHTDLRLTIVSASYHRNGIGGVGFYAILFDDADQGRMVASLFESMGENAHPLKDGDYCAVYSVEELTKGNVAFAHGNSWRGDRYADALRPLLLAYLAKRGEVA